MFVVGVSDHIMVAHSLRGETFGPAQRLHGATYEVRVEVLAPELDADSIVVDIGLLRTVLRETLAPLDYQNLDEVPAFEVPTLAPFVEGVRTMLARSWLAALSHKRELTAPDMLTRMGRHPFRPGHIHMMVYAPGYQTLTTHLFSGDSPYLDSDAVFGVRESLIIQYTTHPPGPAPEGRTMTTPWHQASYDFRLAPSA